MESALFAKTGSEAAVGLSFGNDACFLTLKIEFCNKLGYRSVKKKGMVKEYEAYAK